MVARREVVGLGMVAVAVVEAAWVEGSAATAEASRSTRDSHDTDRQRSCKPPTSPSDPRRHSRTRMAAMVVEQAAAILAKVGVANVTGMVTMAVVAMGAAVVERTVRMGAGEVLD